MRATIMHRARDVRIENVADPVIRFGTDAIIRITRACICGSDLWSYNDMLPTPGGRPMGHEALGIVEDVGSDVRMLKRGDVVVMPFAYSDGTCVFCDEGLHTSCVQGGFFGRLEVGGAQAEALRIPHADGTLVVLPIGADDSLMPSLLALSDVMGTGHHAAVTARVSQGKSVVVIGDGAVGLCGVIASRRLGGDQIIIMGRHPARLDLAKAFGATDIVHERGEAGVARVREMTHGYGVQSVLECVGTEDAVTTALGVVRPGGAIGRVGLPHYSALPNDSRTFFNNIIVSGGPAPVRAYIDDLLPDVLEGRIEPGRVFDRTVDLDGVSDGYSAMNERKALKVMVRP